MHPLVCSAAATAAARLSDYASIQSTAAARHRESAYATMPADGEQSCETHPLLSAVSAEINLQKADSARNS